MKRAKRQLTSNERRLRSRKGAALFVVLMIIMVGTASAVFAASTVSHEVRGTGFARAQMQTRYAAKSSLLAAVDWVDEFGGEVIRELLLTGNNGAVTFPDCTPAGTGGTCYPEPPLANGRSAYRLYREHFEELTTGTNGPIRMINEPVPADAFGPQSAIQPFVSVDIYDEHIVNKLAPGAAAQGGTKFKYLRATVTSRARGLVGGAGGGDVADDPILDRNRQRNETGATYRAYIEAGPIQIGP